MFDQPSNYIPSGIYLFAPLVCNTISLANPFYYGASPVEPEERATGENAKSLIMFQKDKPSCFLVHKSVVMDYAAELVRAVRMIKEMDYQLILCPFRGARMPGIQARVMSDNADLFKPFDGTGMGRGVNDERILNELDAIFSRSPIQTGSRKIGVLDTAIGGYSCCGLARLLGTLNEQTDQQWTIGFHLLHSVNRRPPHADEAKRFQTSRFSLYIYYHSVADLLIEDEPLLLGYDTKQTESGLISHRLQSDGQILYAGQDDVTLYRRAPPDEIMIGIVGEEISRQIHSLPDARLVDPNYWKSQTGQF